MGQLNLEGARQYALDRLERELSPKLFYHSLWHTREDVVPAAQRLAVLEGVTGADLTLLITAAYFHDIGFVEIRVGHEDVSARIAGETLPRFGYSPEQIQKIQSMIMATKLPQSPKTLLEQILADADLDALGREDYHTRHVDLRTELAAYGQTHTDEDWLHVQLDFVREHQYWTPAAHGLRDAGKARHIEQLLRMLANLQ